MVPYRDEDEDFEVDDRLIEKNRRQQKLKRKKQDKRNDYGDDFAGPRKDRYNRNEDRAALQEIMKQYR